MSTTRPPGEDGKNQVFQVCWVFPEVTVDRCDVLMIAANMGGIFKVTINKETLSIPNVGFYTSKCAPREVGVQRPLWIRRFICGLLSNEREICSPHSHVIKHPDHQSVVCGE